MRGEGEGRICVNVDVTVAENWDCQTYACV